MISIFTNIPHIKSWVAIGAMGLLLEGCASLSGSQEPISKDDIGQSVCPSDDQIATFESKAAADRGTYRDDVLSGCIDAVDRKYVEFKSKLQKDAVSTNLAVDLLSLGLTGAASLTKGNTAKDLAAGATALIGAGTAINKDVFYQQTLPAIEAAMDTGRDQVHIRIVQSQSADPTATKYNLASARSDIEAYQEAGSVYAAITQLTSTANQAAQNTQNALAQNKVDFAAQVLDTTVATRFQQLLSDVRGFYTSNNSAKLNAIATALDIPVSTDLKSERSAINKAIGTRVEGANVTDPKGAMDTLSALLSPITGRTY